MINKIIDIIKPMGVFHGVRYIFHLLSIKLFKFNLFEDFYHYQTYKYLERTYKKANKFDINLTGKNIDGKNKCWIMWWQGESVAPEIVKKCIESIRKNVTNYEVVVLTNENIQNYVVLPERIWKMFNDKKIMFAHFSDIVRTYLLYFYGGLWIDATCFLTDKIPEAILQSDVFFFKDTIASVTFLPISNWFIYSKKSNNYVLEKILYGLLFYWYNNNTVCDYFIYHALFRYYVEKDSKFKALIERMPYYCNAEPHVLQKCLFESFNQEKWDLIISSSFCHKLTYKFTHVEKNTFLNYVLLKGEE